MIETLYFVSPKLRRFIFMSPKSESVVYAYKYRCGENEMSKCELMNNYRVMI
jgi:hypothetical protein